MCGSTHDNHSSIFTLLPSSCLNFIFVYVCNVTARMYVYSHVCGACGSGTNVCVCVHTFVEARS